MAILAKGHDKSHDDKRRDTVIKTVILLILSFIVFVLATIAWFTSNKTNTVNGMGVKSVGMPFEISVDSPYTTTPDYSDIVSSEFGYSTDVHETGTGTDSIKWVMYDETYDATNPMRGLKPGSKGTFRFNIIPKVAGTYTFCFTPKITGYYAEFNTDSTTGAINPQSIKTESGEYVMQSLSERATAKEAEYNELIAAGRTSEAEIVRKEYQACVKAEQYLNGHLLLFEERDNSGYYSKLRPINQSFYMQFTFSQSEVDNATPTSVTIYWIWPNTFGQFLLDDGDVKLHDKAMFDSAQEAVGINTPREEIVNYICLHKDDYFESTNPSITGDGLPSFIAGVVNNTSPDNLIALSNGYNNADQIIGENIQILLAEMVVGLVGE